MRYVYGWLAVAGLLVLLNGAVAPASAQPTGPTSAAQDEFVPIDELPAGDQLPAAPFLVAAYAAAWVLVLAYVWVLWRRLDRVQRELAAVQRRLADGPPEAYGTHSDTR